jgi:thiamine transport system ATP-binding protein
MTRTLEVEDLRVRFGDVVAVDGVTFTLADGEVLAVLGPSGCGKSTLLRAVAGLERVDAGTIAFDGQDLAPVPTFRRGFALMFQDGQLFPHLSVADNIGYPLRLRRVPRAERRARVDELLELVGLPGAHDREPATLSGGEAQRVALARALAVRPRLLLLDEPLSALDRDLRERLAGELRDILRAEGTTALLVTHDHDEAFAVADRMAVMRAGRFVQTGTLEDVWRAPADPTTARFLGYAAVLDVEASQRLLAAAALGPGPDGGSLALRRSALRLDPDGPLRATVRSVRTTPEVTRLVVELADPSDLGELDAVAPLGVPVAAGEGVRLRLDPARTSSVPGGRDDLHHRGDGNDSVSVGTGP